MGEWLYQPFNIAIRISYLKMLNTCNIYPKYVCLEESEASCFAKNLYLETGSNIYSFINKHDFYDRSLNDLRNYYLSLPIDKRFKFKGMDVERYWFCPHFAIHYTLKKYQTELDYALNQLKKLELIELNKKIQLHTYSYECSKKFVSKNLQDFAKWIESADSIILKNILVVEDFKLLKKIVKGYLIYKNRKENFELFYLRRQNFICSNIYEAYMEDTSSFLYGQFQLQQVRLNFDDSIQGYKKFEKLSIALTLNSNPAYAKTNNMVYSNIIYYNLLFMRNDYKLLIRRIPEIQIKQKKLQNMQIEYIPLNGSTGDNIIIFKE